MNETNLTIGIITFRQRNELIRELIAKIRCSVPESVDIILAINGNNEEDMPEEYRQEMLDLAKKYVGIYPIFCTQFTSMTKLFNTFVIFSKTEYVFIMGDDVEYGGPHIYNTIIQHINTTGQQFFTINGGFSHFVCSKSMLHKLNYFDERLSSFGNEDGDMHYKHIITTGKIIPTLFIHGIFNKAAYNLRNKNIETFVDNKPRLCQEVMNWMYKFDPNGIINPMDPSRTPMTKVVPNDRQYPYEEFVRKNRHNIAKFEKLVLD